MLEASSEDFPLVVMRQYTEECFLYKDINRILRESRYQTEKEFASKFQNLFPYYLFFLQAQ